ncbi:MAG: TetR/AcrR family transcriptional regulator [Hyphomonadaceae bacterium]|nr:TetR/AcrR family transcriptional regulator [Hyphomonadaceae bacterium]
MGDTETKQRPGDGRRAQAKAANREAILEAARAVFARMGMESATVRDIIRETDLAAGTFYNYFKSKEEVVKALAELSTSRFRPRLAKVRAAAPDVKSYIRAAFHAYFSFLKDENETALRLGASQMKLAAVRYDTPEMDAVLTEVRCALDSFFDEADSPHFDTEYITAAAVGIALEFGDLMLRRHPVDVDGATRVASELFLSGISGVDCCFQD